MDNNDYRSPPNVNFTSFNDSLHLVGHRWTPYPEHLGEEGWNGLEFNSAANCWARNVSDGGCGSLSFSLPPSLSPNPPQNV